MANAHTAEPLVVMRGNRLGDLMRAARTRPVEVFVFGSSLHTLSGNGNVLNALLNRAAAEMFGGTPGTPWMPIASFNSQPPGQWCCRSAKQSAAGSVTGLVSTYAPPDFTPLKLTNAQTYGHLLTLDVDGAGAMPTEFGEAGEFMPLGSKYAVKAVAWSKGGATGESSLSASMKWEHTKSARPGNPTFFGTAVSSQASIAIPTPAAFGAAGAFDPNNTSHQAAQIWCPSTAGGGPTEHTQDASNPLMHMHLIGADAAGFILAGVRWDHMTAPFGLRFHFFGAGGYHSTSLLDNHSNCGPTLQAFGPPDIVLNAYHTNTAYAGGKTAAQYKSDIKTLLDWQRGVFPGAVLGLMGDGYRYNANGTYDANFSEMTGVDADLVREGSPAEFALNVHLATQRAGFTARSHSLVGKTFKGAYNAAVANVVGDVVAYAIGDQTRYFECVSATQGGQAAELLMKDLNGNGAYWRPIRRWLKADPNTAAAPSDDVHLSAYGNHRMAEVILKLMASSMSPKSAGVVRAAR